MNDSLDLIVGAPVFSRVWSMPNSNTFSVPEIGHFVKRYLMGLTETVDPFARNSRLCKWTNDLNPDTAAEYHMEALDFLTMLEQRGVKAQCVIFDPPYSARQVAECYEQVGRKTTMQDTQGASWANWKTAIARITARGGLVLSFGWNTVGMGDKHGFTIREIMLVSHGGVHNDTICMAEKHDTKQGVLFDLNSTNNSISKGDN